MGEKPTFPIWQSLCHNAKVVHPFDANTPFEKLPGTQINVPRLNLHKRPRHRRCPTSRDFVPWRFSDAGRRSAWIASSWRHPKTCTEADIRHASQSLESAVICRPGTLGVLGRGCPLARRRTRVKELAGKTAFVTGAASGIGLGIATAFAQAGAKVMLCDIEEAALSAALQPLTLTQ